MSLLSHLRSALENLAAPPDQQAHLLKQTGTYPSLNEFALDYENWARAAWQLVESGEISEEGHKAVLQLDDRLRRFSGEQYASEWHVGALPTSPNWADVRERARRVLSLIARQLIANAARSMLAGKLSFIEGAREIARLRWDAKLADFDPDILPFIAIDSETDALPVGEARKHWSADALAKTQAEMERRELWAAEDGRAACRRLLDRFASPAD